MLALSLLKKSTRKGFLFIKGPTSISLYQIVESTPVDWTTQAQIERPNSATWQLEVVQTVVLPKMMQLPAASYIDSGVDYILSVAVIMKGLVDLVPLSS